MEEALLVGGALVLGFGAGVVALLVVRRAKAPKEEADAVVELEVVLDESPVTFVPPAPQPAAPPVPAVPPQAAPPPPSPRSHPERQPAMILTRGVQMSDSAFQRQAPPRQAPASMPESRPQPWARPRPREEAPAPVPTEWARRQVGPLEPGRAKGVCSGCGTALSVSMARPLRIACPECGRTRLLA